MTAVISTSPVTTSPVTRGSRTARLAGITAAAAVAAVAVLATGGSATAATRAHLNSAPVVPGTVALTWSPTYMSDDHSYTLAEAQLMAKKYDLVAGMPLAFQNYSAQMRVANPKLTLLSYANATLANDTETSGLPESAFSHDLAGNRVRATNFDDYVMESSSSDWRARANSICNDRVARAGYDGCLMDMLTLGIFSKNFVSALPVDPKTGAEYTQLDYQGQMSQLSSYFNSTSPSLVHVGNAVENSYRYWQSKVPSRPEVTAMPAAQMEDFIRGAGQAVTAFPAPADWLRNVQVITDMQSAGTVGLFTTKLWTTYTPAQLAQWESYSMATFLMGADGHSYFSFLASRDKAGVMGTNLPYTMPKAIGTPLAAMSALPSGAYTRAYSGGIAVVNPTSAPITIALGAAKKSLTGATVSSVTLPADSGDILLNVAATTVDTIAPVVTFAAPLANLTSLSLAGSATDNVAVHTVSVAVRNELTGLWLHTNGTWGSYALLPTTLASPDAASTAWTKTISVLPGKYGASLVSTDKAGNKNTTSPWKVFTVV